MNGKRIWTDSRKPMWSEDTKAYLNWSKKNFILIHERETHLFFNFLQLVLLLLDSVNKRLAHLRFTTRKFCKVEGSFLLERIVEAHGLVVRIHVRKTHLETGQKESSKSFCTSWLGPLIWRWSRFLVHRRCDNFDHYFSYRLRSSLLGGVKRT